MAKILSPGMSDCDSPMPGLLSNSPNAFVPPVPRRISSFMPPSITPLWPTHQISSKGGGILGAPWPNTLVDPGTTPPVITGTAGVGVGVTVGVGVIVGVAVMVGVEVGVLVAVAVGVTVGVAVVVGVAVLVGVAV
jgi:hypothetical protein